MYIYTYKENRPFYFYFISLQSRYFAFDEIFYKSKKKTTRPLPSLYIICYAVVDIWMCVSFYTRHLHFWYSLQFSICIWRWVTNGGNVLRKQSNKRKVFHTLIGSRSHMNTISSRLYLYIDCFVLFYFGT